MTNLDAVLFNGILEKKIATVSRALKVGANVNAQDSSGMSPVHYAISAEQPIVLLMLIQAGANVRVSSFLTIPLFYAITGCEADNGDIIRILIEAGALVNEVLEQSAYTPLHMAAIVRKPKTVQALIQCGADLETMDSNQHTPLLRAVSDCSRLLNRPLKISSSPEAQLKVIQHMVQAGADGSKALMKMVSDCRFGAGQMLDWKISNMEDHDQALAMDSLRSILGPDKTQQEKDQELEIIKLLLQGNIDLNYQDSKGNSLLLHSIAKGSEEILDLLLEAGADPDRPNNKGETPLMKSSTYKNRGTMERLIRASKNINMQDLEGRTALHYAVLFKHPQNLLMLLEGGANGALRTDNDSTALDLAVEKNYPHMVKMLIDAGDDLISSWGLSGIRKAVLTENPALVQIFVDSGIGTDDSVSWYLAKGMRNEAILKLIQGPEHNVCYNLHWDGVEEEEDSPLLHKFSSYGETELVRFLIKAGADVNQRDYYGETALTKALRYERCDVIELLRSSGAHE